MVFIFINKKTLSALTFSIVFAQCGLVSAQTTIISNPYSSTISTAQNMIQNTINVTCVDLSYDLYQGLSDKNNDTSVTKLQTFLNKNNYLKASPNGYFGQGTKSAVKAFQYTNNISNTGRVGPATRQAIRNQTCKVGGNTASVTESISTPKPERINSSNLTITSPADGAILKSENYTNIQWKNVPSAIYDIKLEDKDGLAYGYVASSIMGNSYNWQIGKVYSAKTNSEIYVEPGMYRLSLSSSNYKKDVPDQYSGLFSIEGKPLELESVLPNSVSNSQDNSIVIFGKGFDGTTVVTYRNDDRKRVITPNFVSSDGKIIVFKIPAQAIIGQYYLSVYNTYSSGATSTPSNSLNINIR